MKNLILIRHAKSSWDDAALSDLERPLNKRGKRDAPLMGRLLKQKGLLPDLILASPAKRSRKTAIKIAGEVSYPKDKIATRKAIYLQGVPGLIELIGGLADDHNRVFLIGHNPDLTDLANRLTGSNIANIPTCGLVSIEFSVASWREIHEGGGVLALFERPPKPAPATD
ncbi:MAG TPA: histidine phosphatase family protein [Methylococcaceae bacterium]|jgi:phosphohistidine phosphatase|nr:histidine phosphatase family protein [Methylococcaceae bacterium]